MSEAFTFHYESDNPRRAYRVEVPGLIARLEDLGCECAVKDLSAVGIAFYCSKEQERTQPEMVLRLSLFLDGEIFLDSVEARVIRRDSELVGCEFQNLDRREEFELDKFVLEVQKRMIDANKGTDETETPPEDESGLGPSSKEVP
jgi:c-di-GMP-binding flagellar brake protein YcgR